MRRLSPPINHQPSHNPLSKELTALEAAVLAALPEDTRAHLVADAVAAREAGGLLAQICMLQTRAELLNRAFLYDKDNIARTMRDYTLGWGISKMPHH